jgi:hypothetical protein
MKIGDLRNENLLDVYKQATDFMKLWIKSEGPLEIIRKLMRKDYIQKNLSQVKYSCEACSILFNIPEIKGEVKKEYSKYVKNTLFKIESELNILALEKSGK